MELEWDVKGRQVTVPSGAANFETTRITIRNERVVTEQQILRLPAEEVASSFTGHRIDVEIPNEHVQDMELQHFSLNSICDTDAEMVPNMSKHVAEY